MNATEYEMMVTEEMGARMGDPRKCPRHPHVHTSDASGMHDTPCGECEAAANYEDGEGDTEIAAPAKLPAANVSRFVLAGNAVFTVVSLATGKRFTFKVRAKKGDDSIRFVSVLTGPQNTHDFAFLGTVFPDGFRRSHKSEIGADAPSVKAFAWFWHRLTAGLSLEACEVYHEGKCGKCARPLTVPESIETGLGPICARARQA